MRNVLVCGVLAASLGASAALAAAPESAVPAVAERSVWLIEFEDAPLATFRGADGRVHPKLRGLKPTSPAALGEARLDLDTPAARAYRKALAELRAERLGDIAVRIGRPLDPGFTYDVVNNGVALALTPAEAEAARGIPGVVFVEPEFVRHPMTDAGPAWIHADAIWNASSASGGNRGENRVIGIIDTGITPSHRSFGSNSDGYLIQNPRGRYLGLCDGSATAGCNAKLIGIHDLSSGEGDKEPNDGIDLDGHGTHVAATAAGNPMNVQVGSGTYRLSGVAPRANLISYKACEAEAKCRGSWTLAAINKAVADGVDVINYSIGGDARDPWASGSEMQAMLAAREAGVVVVVSAGNDGSEPGSVTSPANAPWVIGVANVSHDRANVARVTLSGGSTPPPSGGMLAGASLTQAAYGPAALVYAGNYGSALCATGPNVDALPPDTSTSPWSGTPFSGQIVVCDRGIYARVVKGLNVKNAGGGGMILVNAAADGTSVVADAHELPATHLPYAAGVALKQWLASGSGHLATIGRFAVERVPSFGDVLAASSGRGPVGGDWLKPNLAAPGTNILAAYKDSATSFGYMSGTSMAAPHVSGAVALLRGAHPAWGPAEVESALQGTARASVRLPDDVNAAGAFDAGAGTIDLSRAVNAGLYFPVTGAEFRGTSGSARTLNQGALVDGNCLRACELTRTVRDLAGGGQWQASAQLQGGAMTITPAAFTVAAGGSQALQFRFVPSPEAEYGRWLSGSVRLSRVGGGSPDIVLPVSIRPSAGVLPAQIVLPQAGGQVESESGWADVSLSGLIALPSARFAGSDLIEPLSATPMIPQDPTKDEVYDDLGAANEGVNIFRLVADRSGRMRLRVEASSSTAGDVDLYVGRAGSASSMPSDATRICKSSSPTATERCDLVLEVEQGEHFWILVQNWRASAAGRDRVMIDAALVPVAASQHAATQRPLVATGPGVTTDGEAFQVRLAWNDPTLVQGESRWGHLLIGASGTRPDGVAQILVKLTRASSGTPAAAALVPGEKRTMRLLAGRAQDRLYVEVPPNATRLRATSLGSGEVTLYLAHEPSPSSPSIAAAPARSAAAASSPQAGANDAVEVSGSALASGRWYVTPVNVGQGTASFDLSISLDFGGSRPQPGYGNWFNPQRSGSGFFFSPFADGAIWTLSWYTYLQDGTPAWLGGTLAAPGPKQGSATFALYRFSWDGSRTHAVVVGDATLSLVDSKTLWVSFNLDGESGSQRLVLIEAAGGACEPLSGGTLKPDGNWYTQARSGFGFEILTYPGLETYLAYIYDAQGRARWARAHREASAPVGELRELAASVMTGSCPLCSMGPSTTTGVGVIRRRFVDATHGRMGADVTFPAPMGGRWRSWEDVTMLTSPVPCQ
jgi:subtilisin family serine protease